MTDIRIIAISTEIAQAVRSTHLSPHYNHPAYTEVAKGHGPCRHCLRTFQVGQEQRTLFTHDPFEGLESVPLPGPVFIHTASCERYPEQGGYPPELASFPVILNLYARGPKLLDQIFAGSGEAEPRIRQLLANPQIDDIEVRDRNAGCFDFRVERR